MRAMRKPSRYKFIMIASHLVKFSFCILAIASTRVRAADAIEQHVFFQGSNGARLSGTFLIPPHDPGARFGAMVLLAGSGPTDRNGNQPPAMMSDLLKQIAQALSGEGIVTLRYDKRGMYDSARDLPKDKSAYGDFFSWENFVGDAASAVTFLRAQPQVDPDRVGILGHSEGGLLALDAARVLNSQGHSPALLILISTPGRSLDRVMVDQLQGLLARQGAPALQVTYFLGENARITRAIQDTGKVPPDVPAGLAALYPPYLGKFLHSELALEPTKLVADFSGPVLVIAGSADVQVSPDLDAKALDAALSTRKNDVHTLSIIPKASHNMKIPQGADDQGFAGPVAPAAMDELEQWTAAHLSEQAR
jgi:dienelactone hydrolase